MLSFKNSYRAADSDALDPVVIIASAGLSVLDVNRPVHFEGRGCLKWLVAATEDFCCSRTYHIHISAQYVGGDHLVIVNVRYTYCCTADNLQKGNLQSKFVKQLYYVQKMYNYFSVNNVTFSEL